MATEIKHIEFDIDNKTILALLTMLLSTSNITTITIKSEDISDYGIEYIIPIKDITTIYDYQFDEGEYFIWWKHYSNLEGKQFTYSAVFKLAEIKLS